MSIRIGAVVMAAMLVATSAAFGQVTTGTIAGRIVDAQGLVVPGVTVIATGPQGVRNAVTDGEGRFSLPFLVPGTYSVRAELQGFKAVERPNVVVGLGQTVDLNFAMEVGALTDIVEVAGTTPTIDTRTTTVGGILDSETLQHLPVGRSLADTLYLVPGVVDASMGVAGNNANPSMGGASGLENTYIIDGINITDPGFGGFGAYNSTHGSLGTGVTPDFIKETQVKTGGFEAEFGQTTGGVVNAITKSGSNSFSGGLFGYTRPSALQADWKQLSTPNGTVNTDSLDNHDLGISVGGPILRDRLFFFGTYNPQWQNRSFAAPPGFPYESLGALDRKRTIQAYAGKLSSVLTSNHRLDFSAYGDPSKGERGLQRFSTLRRIAYSGAPGTTGIEGGFSELEYGGHNQVVRYDGVLGSRWLLEGTVGYTSQKFLETPSVDDWLYTDLRFTPQGATGGLGFHENNESDRLQFSAKSTNILSGAGSHQIKYGVEVEKINFTRGTNYSGPNLTLANGRTTVTGGPIQIREGGGITYFRSTRGLLVAPGETTADYTSFFLQDTWQMGRLTVTPGVRYDRQYLEGQDPNNYPVPLCFDDDSRPGAGDGAGAGIACNFTWNNWAPRVGATFDLRGDGRAKVFASWGRFYAKIPNDLAARAMSADTGITRQDFEDGGLTQPVANGVSFGGLTTHLLLTSDHAAIIDPDAGSTFKNEFLAGIEFDVLDNANLGFRFIRRTMPQILEDIGQLAIIGYFVAPNTPVDYFITNVNADTPVVQCCDTTVGFEDPEHTYDSFEVTLNKRFSGNWAAIASYRYGRLNGNFEGFFRSDNGQSDPAISSLFDFPTNDPSYVETADIHEGIGDIRYQGCTLGCGRLPNDRPHQLKLYGNYLWRNVNIGVGFNAGSGRPLTAMASNPVYQNAGEIPTTIRGDGIDTSEGFKERTPPEITLDLHADYAFTIAGSRLTVLADIFNLFNRQSATWYDYFNQTTVGVLNPNFGVPANGGSSSTNSFQAPVAVRFGARLDW